MSVSVPEGKGNDLSININASKRSLSDSSLDVSSACNPGKNLLEICNASQITIMAIVQIELCSLMDFDSIVRKLPFDSDSLLSSLSISSCSTAKDADVQIVNESVNLLCPITLTQIKCAVRGEHCKHRQSFDAKSFLLLGLQSQSWICPICGYLHCVQFGLDFISFLVSKFCPKSFCELVEIFRASKEIC